MVPVNYAEWCKLFDEIEKNARNEDYLNIIRSGKISWTSGVAERFIQSFSKLIQSRVNKAQDVYQRQMKNSMGREAGIVSALKSLKSEYSYLYHLGLALPIPDEYKNQITQMVQDQADYSHQSLTDSAKSDRTGKLAAIVKTAGVNKL